ncbi:SDR family NAD(P)-dependent oxidoreductase [Nocardia sp. NPDC005366]|uniref:SDR family NAD(P)-dependent oxidoreductase n=1 Tax=Nocardia sp. NPDC005366 TaxID=3156878 RepID=UPI0033BF7738
MIAHGAGGTVEKIVQRDGSPATMDGFNSTISVYLAGTYNVLRLVAADLANNSPDERGERGAIVATASGTAYEGQIGQSAYAAAKGGVVSLTLAAARDALVVVDSSNETDVVDWTLTRDAEATEAPAERIWAQPMLYTAGTTGRPKGTIWPVSNAVAPETAIGAHASIFALRGMVYDPGSVSLVSGPLYRGAPGAWATMSLHHGQTVLLPGRWDSEGFLQSVERHRVTSAQLAPIHFQRLLNSRARSGRSTT